MSGTFLLPLPTHHLSLPVKGLSQLWGGGGGPLGLIHIKLHFGLGDIQNHRFIFLGGVKGVERVEITIFDFLECWGYEGPIRAYGSGGVIKAPFQFLEWWGMKAPFELFGVVGYCRPHWLFG